MAKKIGLVLGGGGARGLAHIGVLKILENENIKVDFIIGVSIGSLVGSLYALGENIEKIEEESLRINKISAMKNLLDVGKISISLVKGKKINKFISNFVGERTFSDTKIPLYILSTDLLTGEEVLLHEGSLCEAIMSSIAVPGIFPPVTINNKTLVDGGIVNPTPVNLSFELGADKVIAVDLTHSKKDNLSSLNLFATLMQTFEIIRNKAVEYNMSDKKSDYILISPKIRGAKDAFKFYNIHRFVKSGEEATLEKMQELKQMLAK